ncbi:MAG: DUF4118 domain-containing protein [Sporichthyaceae bacterium]
MTTAAEHDPQPARGRLRVYLGAAPGVGKTYAMLGEGRRALERGRDVVVGVVETHGRPRTAEMLEGFEVVPRRTVAYRDTTLEEFDVDAVLARRPRIALIDELAHTNAPGSRNAKRWQDVEELLDAGIDVITTVNVQHLESLNDVVAAITGVPQRETIPDEVVRRATQVELVDMSADALRRRMAHGNVYPPEKIDAALGNYFRIGNLTALRELALLWVAGKVDEQLDRYRAEHGIDTPWEARERVVVALTGGPEGDTLIRRAKRIAARSTGADLLAVHVTTGEGLRGGDPAHLARQRALVESLGGSYHQVVGADVPRALLEFASGANATQLVLGASRRGRFAQLLSRGVGVTTTALSGPIDVHLVTHDEVAAGAGRTRSNRRRSALSGRRRLAGWLFGAAVLPALTFGLSQAREELSLTSDILLFLLAVVATALLGGMWPAVVAAVAASALLNWYFTPPIHTWTIHDRDNFLALVVFVVVAALVSAVVDRAGHRSREARAARARAEVLSTLAGSVLRGDSAPGSLLGRLRETFGLVAVTMLERRGAPTPDDARDPDAWRIVATAGAQPCTCPANADTEVVLDDGLVLLARGRLLQAEDRRVLEAFAAESAVALRQQRLREAAERAEPLAAADRMRTALLAAVSHDLRTPLASATAAVQSLRNDHVEWSDSDRAELLVTAEESLADLRRLVDNLLDMSRLQAGVLGVVNAPLGLEDVVPQAVLGVDARIRVEVPVDLPEVMADAGLLERILVNVARNAARYAPPDSPVLVTASAHGAIVELRVVDRGPGVPTTEWDRMFLPFQRLGDRDRGTGVGLGLALSRGLAEAMGGSLVPEETPGGGLTMVLTLPARAAA